MALRLRRGTNTQRLDNFTPEEGELIYVTDHVEQGVAPVYIGGIDPNTGSLTPGGFAVGSGGGGGGLTDIINDTSPQLGGDLDPNGFAIDGIGDIILDGAITATGNIAANNFVATGGGSFTGNFIGPLVGDTDGTHTGNVIGDADGDHTGTFTGIINATGVLTGDVSGSVFADDSSVVVDGQNGLVKGDFLGGAINIPNTGLVASDSSDSPYATVSITHTNDKRSQLELVRKKSVGVIADGDDLGAIHMVADDANGFTRVFVQQVYRNAMVMFHDKDGTIDINNVFTFREGKIGIGTNNPSAKLQVNGNGLFAGEVEAPAFKGTFVADDSTILVDGVNSKLTLANNNLADLGNVSATAPNAGEVLKWDGSNWGPASDVSGSGSTESTITGATQANPVVVTTSANHNLVNGQPITITDVVGMTELNGNTYYVDVLTGTTVALYDDSGLSTSTDGTGFTAYTSDGIASGGATDASTLGGFTSAYHLDFTNHTNTPTTVAGYGITDAFDGAFSSLTGTPTTLAGYGITDSPSDITDLGIADGTVGQVLTTDGAGTFTFEDVSGLNSRATVAGTTASIADGADDDLDITGYKGYFLYKIQTDGAAWVRIYVNAAKRTADAARTEGQDPGPDAGVIAEVITTGAETVIVAPGIIGFNDESPVTNVIPCAVRNKTGSTGTVTVTLTAVEMEV